MESSSGPKSATGSVAPTRMAAVMKHPQSGFVQVHPDFVHEYEQAGFALSTIAEWEIAQEGSPSSRMAPGA